MAKKKKNRPSKRRKPTRKDQRASKQARRRAPRVGASFPSSLLAPVGPDRCREAIHLDGNGLVVPDPRGVLGLPPGAVDEATVRAAYRQRLLVSPPETDPEGARRLREARDRLLSPERVIERIVGQVHVPDPGQWGLRCDDEARPQTLRLDPEARLVGQALLYALLEDELVGTRGRPPEQQTLF